VDTFEKLSELFNRFPGIGPRQSRRFVYFLLGQSPQYAAELSRLIAELPRSVASCRSCFRYFPASAHSDLCGICGSSRRDTSLLMVVERDADLESMEKSRAYQGRYFVLGASIPILEKNPEETVRLRQLKQRIEQEGTTLSEVILAMSLTTEGEHTMEHIAACLRPMAEEFDFKISTLGRGLSTGTELEYSDATTIANAFKTRT
jgi:recombination protein RecR